MHQADQARGHDLIARHEVTLHRDPGVDQAQRGDGHALHVAVAHTNNACCAFPSVAGAINGVVVTVDPTLVADPQALLDRLQRALKGASE